MAEPELSEDRVRGKIADGPARVEACLIPLLILSLSNLLMGKNKLSFVLCLTIIWLFLLLLWLLLLWLNLNHFGLCNKPRKAVTIINMNITTPKVQTNVLGALYDP